MLLFALKTLVSDRGKLLIAVVGVVFSFVLVNVQGGLFLGMIRKASLIVDHSDADIWVGHRGIENADIPADIPEAWLSRIRGLPGVLCAEPFIMTSAPMSLPDGGYEAIWVIGSEPTSMMGSAWVFSEGGRQDLYQPDSIAVDELDDWKLGYPKVGDVMEISGRRAKIVAKTKGILGFLTTPYVFTTLESARTYARMPQGYCSYFLVRADEEVNLKELCETIRHRVPDLDVYTAADFSYMSRVYWLLRTGLGMSFGGATVLGLMVGLVMVAQSLYALVLDHLSDYATLKAIGAEDGQVYRVVVLQALTIAFFGTALGVTIVALMSSFLSTAYAPIEIPAWLLLVGMGLVVLICLLSSLMPFRRIRNVDPVIVLQG